ncbi:6212_t:CDS:2 [Funneliformis mosseae]|uniref:6212_t:CDS:1 n=1 Tax=Funneliformis mosseae TaxID=27381 RepID=A0A9N9ECE0_FUNMO|nr:6212_t:CDS:2 [Funneliformis mosseae]
MTKFITLKEIEAEYPERENETVKVRKKRQCNIRQVRKRFLNQQAREESIEVGPSNEPYITQIRAYNQVLAFTSLDVNLNEELANAKKRIYIFRIQGKLYYQISILMLRDNNQKLTFAQIYFYDLNMNNQLQRRQEIFSNLNAEMLIILQDELSVNNPFVEQL